jgi:hypothetical protein
MCLPPPTFTPTLTHILVFSLSLAHSRSVSRAGGVVEAQREVVGGKSEIDDSVSGYFTLETVGQGYGSVCVCVCVCVYACMYVCG